MLKMEEFGRCSNFILPEMSDDVFSLHHIFSFSLNKGEKGERERKKGKERKGSN